MEPYETGPRAFALRGGEGALVFHRTGLRHPRSPRILGETVTAYRDVTHHTVTSRGLRLATRRSVYWFPRGLFEDPRAPDAVAAELMDRIAREPGGREQLDRMWRAEKRSARPRPVRLALWAAIACVVVFAGVKLTGQRLFLVGLFSAPLVREGEFWRLATANLLHGDVWHLSFNVLGLLGIGALVERVLGTLRTALVLGLGGLGGMSAGLLVDYPLAVGASAMVFGLVGALVWLELACAERLPAAWRLPRVLLLGALAGDALLSIFLPQIAAAAHAGGFAAGLVACAWLASGALERRPPGVPVWATVGLLLFGLSASLMAAGTIVAQGGSVFAHRGRTLVDRAAVDPMTLNNLAWLIATDPGATPEDQRVAVLLAERAVSDTERRDPNILDTLAEALFAAGSSDEAVRTIDEAIALAPGERYFQEQRRRFTGEREPDDRPPPPERWIVPEPGPGEEPLPEPDDEDGFRV